MAGTSAAAKILPFKNQLDDKQYRQMVAPAFQCSSAALQQEHLHVIGNVEETA